MLLIIFRILAIVFIISAFVYGIADTKASNPDVVMEVLICISFTIIFGVLGIPIKGIPRIIGFAVGIFIFLAGVLSSDSATSCNQSTNSINNSNTSGNTSFTYNQTRTYPTEHYTSKYYDDSSEDDRCKPDWLKEAEEREERENLKRIKEYEKELREQDRDEQEWYDYVHFD